MNIVKQLFRATRVSLCILLLQLNLSLPCAATIAKEHLQVEHKTASWQDAPHQKKQTRQPIKLMTLQTTTANWKIFMGLTPKKLSRYWNGDLSTYHWSWRLGWLQQCGKLSQKRCSAIQSQGIADRAAVVRSKAAEVIGTKFESSDSAKALNLVSIGLSNKDNFRGQQPLFVVKRLLWAYAAINKNKSKTKAPKIVSTSPELQRYWSKLVSPYR